MEKMDDAVKDGVQEVTISAEEAYRYANDKRVFQQMLPKEGGVNG